MIAAGPSYAAGSVVGLSIGIAAVSGVAVRRTLAGTATPAVGADSVAASTLRMGGIADEECAGGTAGWRIVVGVVVGAFGSY